VLLVVVGPVTGLTTTEESLSVQLQKCRPYHFGQFKGVKNIYGLTSDCHQILVQHMPTLLVSM